LTEIIRPRVQRKIEGEKVEQEERKNTETSTEEK
jgi:hypothetical protein